MSEMAFSVVFSCLSGTKAHTMLVNRPSSLMKKKDMKTTEKRPTPKLVRNEVAEPITEDMVDTLNIFWSSFTATTSRRKSSPS